jgi:GATA zinc finger
MTSESDSSWSSYPSSQGPPVKSQQEIEMELIRNKRMAAQSGVKGKYTKRNVRPHFSPRLRWLTSLPHFSLWHTQKRTAPPQKCTSCGTKETPEWRRGPDGQRSLCNACGLREFLARLIQICRGRWSVRMLLHLTNRFSSLGRDCIGV